MVDTINREELELDRYIGNLDKSDIKVPDMLEDRIKLRVDSARIHRNNALRISATSAAAIILIISCVLFIPGISSYAQNVPVIRDIIEFIKGDPGTEAAKKNGYMGNVLVSTDEDGYKFSVNSIILDEERLVITGTVSGTELKYKNGIYPADIEIVPKDFKRGANAGGGGGTFQGNDDAFTFKFEERFKPGEVQKFVDKKQNYIELDVMIYRKKEDGNSSVGRGRKLEEGWMDKVGYEQYWADYDTAIKEFKGIRIPLDSDKVQLTKYIKVGSEIDKSSFPEYGFDKITIDNFVVGPTIMKLQFNSPYKEHTYLGGFVNGHLEDDKGNIYKNKSMDTTGCDMTVSSPNNFTRMLEFVPSVYFDMDKFERLYFCFDGIKLVTSKGPDGTDEIMDVKGRIEINLK